MEPRFLAAYVLLALLGVAGALGLWRMLTTKSRHRRRERDRFRARRVRQEANARVTPEPRSLSL